jgi:hypothetical protein
MVRQRWCEVGSCENKAQPNTVPPACKKHLIPMCAGKTKFKKPCTYHAVEGDTLCRQHRKMANGEFHLTKSPNCKYLNDPDWNGNRCSRKAANGMDVCVDHIEDPEIRKRERKRVEINKQTGSERMRQLLMGEMSVEDLDDEELLSGQFRDVNGRMTGRPPAIIPKVLHEKMMGELFRRTDQRLQQRLFDVVNVMIDIATNPDESAKDRRAAAQWVYERLRGKTPEVLTVKQERPFEIVMEKIVAGPRTRGSSALPIENVEEAEWSEEDEDEE